MTVRRSLLLVLLVLFTWGAPVSAAPFALSQSDPCIAAKGAARAGLQDGLIMRQFATSQGTLEMAAEVVIKGKMLHLKDIAVFPLGRESLSLGVREVVSLRNQLAAEARSLGFEQLRITGLRLTGAYPGKKVDLLINLMK
jgi:hypothetical protein